jgi:hypothetical protein
MASRNAWSIMNIQQALNKVLLIGKTGFNGKYIR